MPNVPVELTGREQIRTWGERAEGTFDYFIQTTYRHAFDRLCAIGEVR